MSMSFYGNSSENFCSVQLPPTQPMALSSAPCAQRLFIVCSPHVLPLHVLKKVFCRFGFLIDVYLLNNRNCGYVKYAKVESARQVMNYYRNFERVLCMQTFNWRLKLFLSGNEDTSRCWNLWCSIESARSRGTVRLEEANKNGHGINFDLLYDFNYEKIFSLFFLHF